MRESIRASVNKYCMSNKINIYYQNITFDNFLPKNIRTQGALN